jgi:hypothetical protein
MMFLNTQVKVGAPQALHSLPHSLHDGNSVKQKKTVATAATAVRAMRRADSRADAAGPSLGATTLGRWAGGRRLDTKALVDLIDEKTKEAMGEYHQRVLAKKLWVTSYTAQHRCSLPR